MLSIFSLKHYSNFKLLESGYLPSIPWHLLIYFYNNTWSDFECSFNDSVTLRNSKLYSKFIFDIYVAKTGQVVLFHVA